MLLLYSPMLLLTPALYCCTAHRMAEAAVRREWGCEPLYVREGGTMPVASVLERLLAAPAIMIPMGQSSDSPHLANERIRRANLLKVWEPAWGGQG